MVYSIITVAGVVLLPDAVRLKVGLPLMITTALSMGAYAWLKFWLIPNFILWIMFIPKNKFLFVISDLSLSSKVSFTQLESLTTNFDYL
ncbi:MAG: hypothetical protein MET45_03080 [Nostoc sp. LLA-1]|nr:hypothetical protein [Cyanocohniella sp. LLY]